jgi:clan AA aspartic protease
MTGTVDNTGRALLRVRLRHPIAASETDVDAWVDTGFTGELVIPQAQVDAVHLPAGLAVRATLADGSDIVLNSYSCLLDWFGAWQAVEVIVNAGQFPLLGVGLLRGHELHIDYRTNTMTLV